MKRILITLLASLAVLSVSAQTVCLSLDDCLRSAENQSNAVRGSRLDCEAALGRRTEARMEWFPSVSISALAFHSLNPLIDITVTDVLGKSEAAWNIRNAFEDLAAKYGFNSHFTALNYGWTAAVSLMQPIYAGGRIVNGNRLASLGVEAARLQLRQKERDNFLNIEKAYWQVVSLQEKAMTLRRSEELLDSLKKDVESAAGAGLATPSDVSRVMLKKKELQSGKVQLEGGTRLAKMALLNEAGIQFCVVRGNASATRPYIDDIYLAGDIEDLQAPENYYVPEEELAQGTAESRLLQLQVEAKALEKKMSLGESLPQVGIGASYGYGRMMGEPRANGMLYAMVSVPVSDWGKAAGRMKRLEAERQKAEGDKEFYGKQLVLQASSLWVQLCCAWEKMQVSSESIVIAAENQRQTSCSYEAGLCTLSELLEAQLSLRNAENQHIDDCIAYRMALSEYLSLQR